MQPTTTLILGAGPAGLAVAGRLANLGLPFLILEKTDRIAASWHAHYDRLQLHTVKEHSNLPHLELPKDWPTYVPRLDMIKYWNGYAEKMGIRPLFGQEVRNIRREAGHWIVQTNTDCFRARSVVVATGYNRMPKLPDWPGLDRFKGLFLHSCAYKNAAPFGGQKVLLIGIGNTGAELALDLAENGAEPVISVRHPVNFVRRDVAGRPAQKTAILLSKLPPRLYDRIARLIQKWTIGDLSAYGLPPSPYAPSEQMRRFGKIPVIDIGALDLIKQGKIRIAPDIGRFDEQGVLFANGQYERFDAVIACTGYRAGLEDFFDDPADLLNERGYPRSLWFDDKAREGLFFCGFSVPLNGVLRNIKLDSAEIVRRIGKLGN